MSSGTPISIPSLKRASFAAACLTVLIVAALPVDAHHAPRIDGRIVNPYNQAVLVHVPVVAGYEPVPTPLHCLPSEPAGDIVWQTTFASTAGWSYKPTPLAGASPNLWGRTTNEVKGSGAGHSKDGHLYFGDVARGDYDDRGHVAGTAEGPEVSVPSNGPVSLVFATKWEVEWLKGYEHLWIEAREPNGKVHILCTANALDRGEASSSGILGSCSPYLYAPCPPGVLDPSWETRSIRLPASLLGKDIRIRFTFDASDDVANNFMGWMVDDVRIVKEPGGLLGSGVPVDPSSIQQVRRVIRLVTENTAADATAPDAMAPDGMPPDAVPGDAAVLAQALDPLQQAGAQPVPSYEEPARVLRALASAEGRHVAPTPPCVPGPWALDALAARVGVAAPDLTDQPVVVQDAVACLADGLHAVNAARDVTFAQIPTRLILDAASDPAALERLLPTLAGREHDGILDAAVYLADRVAEAGRGLTAADAAGAASVDVPPLLRIARAGADVHVSNYALTIDLGGDDVYDNHAGGVLVVAQINFESAEARPGGIRYSVAGAGVRVGDAVQDADAGLTSSVVLDLGGDDQYGVLHAPMFGDERCTEEWLFPLALAQGAGLAGVGMLVDSGGDNTFLARAQSQGIGHILGVGVIATGDGHDTFRAVRSAQGQGLLGGVGVLIDTGGDSVYETHVPVGGTLNNDLAVCDDVPRYMQGSAFDRRAGPLLPSVGVLLDRGGDDMYLGGGLSQGFGQGPGFGLLFDEAGSDSYTALDKSQGAAQGRSRDFNPQAPWGGGLGLLIDRAGSDKYQVPAQGQGWALADGTAPPFDVGVVPWAVDRNEALGVLVDVAGVDTYSRPGRTDGAWGTDGVLGVWADLEPRAVTGAVRAVVAGTTQGVSVSIDAFGVPIVLPLAADGLPTDLRALLARTP